MGQVVLVLQARMGSTRLPGKVMKPVLGRPLLAFLLERLSRVRLVDELVVATTELQEDAIITQFAEAAGVRVVRGSEQDVLGRFVAAAVSARADVVVRVCGDCPLLDAEIVDEAVAFFQQANPRLDWVGNFLKRSYPRGYEVEVLTAEALYAADKEARAADEREHVTPYIYRHPQRFHLGSVEGQCNAGHLRLVVDTAEDFELVQRVLHALYPAKPLFGLQDVLELLQQHPEWIALNAHVQQRIVVGLPGEEKNGL